MIRPFTAVCALLAGVSGLYLYSEKHRTTVLDQQISKIVQDTQHVRERTGMLRAEWALLNQPDRLQSLATRFLPDLHPMEPVQFVQMASLTDHLPAIQRPVTRVPVAMNSAMLAPEQVMARSLVGTSASRMGDPLPTDGPAATDASPDAAPNAPGDQALDQDAPSPPAPRAASSHPAIKRHDGVHRSLARAAGRGGAPVTVFSTGPAQYSGQHTLQGPGFTPLRATASNVTPSALGTAHPSAQSAAYRWHGAARQAAAPISVGQAYPAPAHTSYSASARSALGFAHASLAAPVPVRETE